VLQVSNLAVEVAKKIGANALLVRTGALYHDLGKMVNPMYYTENQTGINPLNELPYEEAAQVIISHVQEGVKIAEKHNLPYQIIEFISMHHGCSKVKYFYNSFKNKYPDREIDERKFTYPGPLPATKETAILMIADAVESAVRAAKNPSNEEIDAIIQKIIKERLNDGQLEDSPLTLKDLKTIAETFSRMLRGMHHKRIKYHNDLVQELDKNNKQLIIPTIEEALPALDVDLESKIKELESKKNDND
jgi:putative nucleotidyltransferase with HDIG domain